MNRVKQLADAIDAFVVGCKSDNTWDAIKTCCILAGWNNLSGCLIPIKGAPPTNTNFVAGDYDRANGLQGGTGKFLNANYPSAASQQNSRHDAVYVTTAATASNSMYWTTQVDAPQTQVAVFGSDLLFRAWQGSNSTAAGQSAATGFIGASRTNSSAYTMRAGGLSFTGGGSGAVTHTATLSWFGRTNGGFVINGRMSFVSVGDGLNIMAFEARVQALLAAIGAAV
jgi:hypothetical protein